MFTFSLVKNPDYRVCRVAVSPSRMPRHDLKAQLEFEPRGSVDKDRARSPLPTPPSTKELTLHRFGEFIQRVTKYHAHNRVHGVSITTNLGRPLSAGQLVGNVVVTIAPRGFEIRSFDLDTPGEHDTKFLHLGELEELTSECDKFKTALEGSALVEDDEKIAILAHLDMAQINSQAFENRQLVPVSATAVELSVLVRYARKQLEPSITRRLLEPVTNRLVAFEQAICTLKTLPSMLVHLEAAELTRLKTHYPAARRGPATIAAIHRFVDRPVTRHNYQLLLAAHATYAEFLGHSVTVDPLFQFLISFGHNDDFVGVITRCARVSSQTIPVFVASLEDHCSLLKHAVQSGNAWVFEWLTTAAALDPFTNPSAAPSSSQTRLEDLVEAVVDCDAKEAIRHRLLTIQREQSFAKLSALLDHDKAASLSELTDLVRNMTGVWDLQMVYRLGKTYLAVAELQVLLLFAFQQVLDEELVAGVDASTSFMLALEFCEARTLVSHVHAVHLKEQFDLVKQANSPRFKAVERRIRLLELTQDKQQQQLDLLHHHYSQLQQFLVNKQVTDMQRMQRDRVISLISTALFLVGGPALRLLGDWLDNSQPLHLLTAMLQFDGDDLTKLLTDTTAELVFREGVEDALHKVDIDPAFFIDVLRNTVRADASKEDESKRQRQRWHQALRTFQLSRKRNRPSTKPMTVYEIAQLTLAQDRCRFQGCGGSDTNIVTAVPSSWVQTYSLILVALLLAVSLCM